MTQKECVIIDEGSTAVFTGDVDEGGISKITLSLDIPSSLSDDLPTSVLEGQDEKIVVVHNRRSKVDGV